MAVTFWEEAYRIGIDELDNEHMELGALMARFQQALDDHEEQILWRIDYPEEDVKAHIDGHLDVLYTFDHEFSKWEKAPGDPPIPGGLSHVCVGAITELLTADMQVKDHLSRSRPDKASRQ